MKAALLDRIIEVQADFVPEASRDGIADFTRKTFAHVAPDDLSRRSVGHLAHAALSLWQFSQERGGPGAKIRIFTPETEDAGWTARASLIQIVNADMPFLVDSVTAALQRMGLTLKLVVHPVLRVTRDDTGLLQEVAPALEGEITGPGEDLGLESIMHIEINRTTDQERQDSIIRRLRSVLDDVRAAVNDWSAMRELCVEIAERIGTDEDDDHIAEAQAFLKWAADNHFTFLGYRHYQFEGDGDGMMLKINHADGLGILADQAYSVFDGLRNFQQLPVNAQELFRRENPLFLTKSNRPATVHRSVPMDAIIVKERDAEGKTIGEHLLLGLFTSIAYNRSARDIPYLRAKVQRAIAAAGLPEQSHTGKALAHILDTYPRDELFQMTDDELLDIATGVLHLTERPRVALFIRRDPFDRFVSCMVYVPRDRYDTSLRQRWQRLLETEFGAEVSSYFVTLDATVLARIQFILTTQDPLDDVNVEEVEKRLAEAARVWEDRLQDALIEAHGEEEAERLLELYGVAFPAGYRERETARQAIMDIARIENILSGSPLAMSLYKPVDAEAGQLHFRLCHPGRPLSLSKVLPTLDNLGLQITTERPFEIRPKDHDNSIWLHDFEGRLAVDFDGDLESRREAFHDAFAEIWAGAAENDPLNRLILSAGLTWREVALLRAYSRYLRQLRFPLSQLALAKILAANPKITKELVSLHHAMHDPAGPEDKAARDSAVGGHLVALDHALEDVNSLDDDRAIRAFISVIRETLRTNYFQRDKAGGIRPWIAFKLNAAAIDEVPLPRPQREIFVYSPRFEAVHLRGGLVARGGLRWSDRNDDFRTEVLGLMKAQMVKNAVIVPVGAKGGFVLKQPPTEGGRDAFQAEGVACYKLFIRALLEITDNIIDGAIVAPQDVVRHDDDDPYMVVAADKGTATFSDIANGVAAEHDFWLDDAFASGGSAGYDHKGMGITAKGGWESVKRHFREIGKNIQEEPFTCVGVGDMSGDVFGNGMLLSEQTKLIAAFNHLHIFIDPDPDPPKSFAERKRMFELPRSAWTDYDEAVMSKGGAVYDRSAKSLTITPEIQELLGLDRDKLTPTELIRAVLLAETELLWFGGIGTYIKAADESHGDVGDKANDQIRIDGRELRAKVIGEGANLGVTQAGRIEAAEYGVRLNTDFIDNSAGVDCSDHEVNIKILLRQVMAENRLNREDRNTLLADMTDEVSDLVLMDNYLQTQAISLALAEGPKRFEDHVRLMRQMERQGILNRKIEGLPDDEAVSQRSRDGRGMTRPEFSVLLAYSKIKLYDELLASDLPDDDYLVSDLVKYFPRPIRRQYRDDILSHQLRREIIATVEANSIVNRAGPTFAIELADKTGMGASEIARAYAVVRECFSLREMWGQIQAGDNYINAADQCDMMRWTIRLIERGSAWFLNNLPQPLDIAATVERFKEPLEVAVGCLETMAPEPELEGIKQRREAFEAAGAAPELARRVARIPVLFGACDIARTAEHAEVPVAVAAKLYTEIGDYFGTSWLRLQAIGLPRANHWRKQAVIAILDDLYALQAKMTREILTGVEGEFSPEASNLHLIEKWTANRTQQVARLHSLLAEFRSSPEVGLSMLAIANRQLRSLSEV
ncbi:MAG: NAD-glutamate dehydrogenase [Alphaproteobacteria bacterium]|nr:NAD-glutamate dehydrogenase [Alphaproteobacteria bacterium SS10]